MSLCFLTLGDSEPFILSFCSSLLLVVKRGEGVVISRLVAVLHFSILEGIALSFYQQEGSCAFLFFVRFFFRIFKNAVFCFRAFPFFFVLLEIRPWSRFHSAISLPLAHQYGRLRMEVGSSVIQLAELLQSDRSEVLL